MQTTPITASRTIFAADKVSMGGKELYKTAKLNIGVIKIHNCFILKLSVILSSIVVIQLASAFLLTAASGSTSLISIIVATGLFFTLIKIPQSTMQMVLFSSGKSTFQKVGGQIVNVINSPTYSANAVTKKAKG